MSGWCGEWYGPIAFKSIFVQWAVRCGFIGWFLSDWHLQPCCSRITVGGSPPSRQTASLLMLRLGQGVEHDYGSCFLVLVTLSLTDVIALSAQLTQLCGLVPPSADSRAGAGMSASTGIYSLTHSPLGYRSPSKRGSMVALCFRNCICRLVELICSYLYLRSHLSLFWLSWLLVHCRLQLCVHIRLILQLIMFGSWLGLLPISVFVDLNEWATNSRNTEIHLVHLVRVIFMLVLVLLCETYF